MSGGVLTAWFGVSRAHVSTFVSSCKRFTYPPTTISSSVAGYVRRENIRKSVRHATCTSDTPYDLSQGNLHVENGGEHSS